MAWALGNADVRKYDGGCQLAVEPDSDQLGLLCLRRRPVKAQFGRSVIAKSRGLLIEGFDSGLLMAKGFFDSRQ